MRRREPGPADRRCDTRWQSVALALALAAGCLTCSSYAVDAVAPDTLAIDLGHADAAYAARQWQEAFQAYQRIADSYPSLAVAVFRLGKCAAKLGLSARATDAFHHAATLSPTDPLVRGELADALRIEKRIDEAEYQYHRAIEIAGADAHPAWSVGLGLVAMARGSLSDAERHFSKALRLAPDAAAIHYNLGEVSLRQNQIDDARHAYEAAIEHDEAFPIAHFGLGRVAERVGAIHDAARFYTRASEIDPDEPSFHAARARVLARTGHPEESAEAHADYRRATALK